MFTGCLHVLSTHRDIVLYTTRSHSFCTAFDGIENWNNQFLSFFLLRFLCCQFLIPARLLNSLHVCALRIIPCLHCFALPSCAMAYRWHYVTAGDLKGWEINSLPASVTLLSFSTPAELMQALSRRTPIISESERREAQPMRDHSASNVRRLARPSGKFISGPPQQPPHLISINRHEHLGRRLSRPSSRLHELRRTGLGPSGRSTSSSHLHLALLNAN